MKEDKPESKKTFEKPKVVRYVDDEDDSDSDDANDFNFHRSSQQLSERARELLKVRQNLPIYHHKEKITQFVSKTK